MADTFDPDNYMPVRSGRPVMHMQVKGSLWNHSVAPAVIWILLAFALLPAVGALASHLPGVDSVKISDITTGVFALGLMAVAAHRWLWRRLAVWLPRLWCCSPSPDRLSATKNPVEARASAGFFICSNTYYNDARYLIRKGVSE